MAVLATLRLLRQLPPDARPALRCNVFACPAIGNAALAVYVKEMGWESYFNNLLVPGARIFYHLATSMLHYMKSTFCLMCVPLDAFSSSLIFNQALCHLASEHCFLEACCESTN